MVVVIESKVTIHKYSKVLESEWESFLAANKCFTFQFQRRFLDLYPADFQDASYLIRNFSGELLAIIALGEFGETKQIISHPKSSFGGFVYTQGVSLKLKELIYLEFLEEIYRRYPDYTFEIRTPPRSFNPAEYAQERWLLWRFGFNINQITLHSIIDLLKTTKPDIKRIKYQNDKIQIVETKSLELLESFWKLLQENLLIRYKTFPTHTFQQIRQLVEAFPNEIRIFLAFDSVQKILGGLIFFNIKDGFHLQYMSVGDLGRKLSVGDLLINHTLKIAISESVNFFDFGHSHEKNGYLLNYNLFSYKSKFGSQLDESTRWILNLVKHKPKHN